MAPHPRPPSPSPKNAEQYLSRAYLNVSDCVVHTMVYPVCNDIPRDIPERDPPRTYVRTYVLCENRSPIQSLALMHSAIMIFCIETMIYQHHSALVRTQTRTDGQTTASSTVSPHSGDKTKLQWTVNYCVYYYQISRGRL